MKEANYISKKNRFKIMAEKSNKSLIISTNQKPYSASIRLLRFLVPFIDCVTIQGLSFSGFIVVAALVLVAASLLGLFEYLKMWRWLRMHQLKARKSTVKQKPSGETRSKAVGKWAWIEDLVSGLDVSGIDDLFITTCILVGLGFLCGFLVLFRRFYSKNVRK